MVFPLIQSKNISITCTTAIILSWMLSQGSSSRSRLLNVYYVIYLFTNTVVMEKNSFLKATTEHICSYRVYKSLPRTSNHNYYCNKCFKYTFHPLNLEKSVTFHFLVSVPVSLQNTNNVEEVIEDDDFTTHTLERLSSAATCLVKGVEYTHGQQVCMQTWQAL